MENEDLKKHVAEVIRQARKHKGLTQKELGEKLGIAEDRVSRYESGRLNPTVETLQEIFNALEIKVKISIND